MSVIGKSVMLSVSGVCKNKSCGESNWFASGGETVSLGVYTKVGTQVLLVDSPVTKNPSFYGEGMAYFSAISVKLEL